MKKIKLYVAGSIAIVAGLYYVSTLNAQTSDEKVISQTIMPSLAPSFDEGRQLYSANCAACHGSSLGGVVSNGPPLVHAYYNSGHHGDAAFFSAVANGVQAHHWRFGNMPKIESLNRSEVRQIIKYVRAVQGANGLH